MLGESQVTLTCFDTVKAGTTSYSIDRNSTAQQLEVFKMLLDQYDDCALNLQQRVTETLDHALEGEWEDGMPIDGRALARLVSSGSVVEIVLAPYHTVRDYVENERKQ